MDFAAFLMLTLLGLGVWKVSGAWHNKIAVLKSDKLQEMWCLGAPTVMEQALQTFVLYIDTAMVGRIGAGASAAVGLTTTVNWLFNGIFFTVSVAMLSIIARYTGEGDMEAARRTSAQAVWLLVPLSVVTTAAALLISPYLPGWMNASPGIWEDAGTYFFIISCPMLFRGALTVYGNVLRANKDTKTPMYINIFVNILNIALNQMMIGSGTHIGFGAVSLFIPGAGWGVAGAAVATAVSQSIGGVIMIAAAMKNPLTTMRGQRLKPDRYIIKNCFIVAFPLMGERLLIGSGQIMFSALVAGLGTLSTAAHSIALAIEEAFYIPGYGMQTAVSTLAGNAVGRRSRKELSEVVKAGMLIAVSIMSFMAVFLFAASPLIMSVFSGDADVIALGSLILRIVAVSEPLFAVLIILEGIFHGAGETRAPFFIAAVTMWGIRIFFTWLSVSVFGAGLAVVWVCMVMDNVCRCALLAFLYRTNGWKKRLGLVSS